MRPAQEGGTCQEGRAARPVGGIVSPGCNEGSPLRNRAEWRYRVDVVSDVERLEHAFPILRIFADFRMPRRSIRLLWRGSEGSEPKPT